MKRVTIAFTSGADSTLLLELALKAGYYVNVFYATISNNEEKAKLEIQQAKQIISLLENKYNAYINTDCLTENNIGINTRHRNTLKFTQALIWPLFAAFNSSKYCDEIWFGYHDGDDIIPMLQNVINLYNSYKPFKDDNVNFPELTFPLLTKTKSEILCELSQDLLPLIFSCEYPLIDEEDNELYCGECGCNSCNKYKKLKDEWTNEYNPFNYTKYLGLPTYFEKHPIPVEYLQTL